MTTISSMLVVSGSAGPARVRRRVVSGPRTRRRGGGGGGAPPPPAGRGTPDRREPAETRGGDDEVDAAHRLRRVAHGARDLALVADVAAVARGAVEAPRDIHEAFAVTSHERNA